MASKSKKWIILVTLLSILVIIGICMILPFTIPLEKNELETGPNHYYVEINGKQVHYFMQGQGDPVILLHSGGTSWHDWENIIPRLSQKYTVYAPDFPGCGNSEELDTTHNINSYTNFLKSFIDAVGLADRKVNIIGMSFGGMTAINYTIEYGQNVKTLGLLEVSNKYPHPERKNFLSLLASLSQNRGFREITKWWIYQLGSRGLLLSVDLDTGRDFLRASSRATVEVLLSWSELELNPADISNIKIPVLLSVGENDKEVPVSSVEELYELLPNSDLIVIPGVSHYDFGKKNLGYGGDLDNAIFRLLTGVDYHQ